MRDNFDAVRGYMHTCRRRGSLQEAHWRDAYNSLQEVFGIVTNGGEDDSEEGDSACSPCPAGAYSDEWGSGECSVCPAPTTSLGPGATSCAACAAGYFWDASRYLENPCVECCVECPDSGAECLAAGVRRETLPLEPRWWRASPTSGSRA